MVVQPPQDLRQVGYESGDRFCAAEAVSMNQTFTQAVPYVDDGTEWVDVNAFDGGRVAALRYRFDPPTGRYHWTDIGPFVAGAGAGAGIAGEEQHWRHSEASIARAGDAWVICSRASTADREGDHATGWVYTADPFADVAGLRLLHDPPTTVPRTLYACPDGELRLLTGDPTASPYGLGRNPLYIWQINARTGAADDRRLVYDGIAAGALPAETDPVADMAKLLPHAGGDSQYVVWRVRTRNVMHNYDDLIAGAKVATAYGVPPLRDEWKPAQGIYYGRLRYDRAYPGRWSL